MNNADDAQKPPRWTERDGNNIIRGAGLSSEEARRMAETRYAKEKVETELADALLLDLTGKARADADPSSIILADKAAAGSVEGLRLLLAQSRKLVRQAAGNRGEHWNGEGPCPACGANTNRLVVTDKDAVAMAGVLAQQAQAQYEDMRAKFSAGQSVELICS